MRRLRSITACTLLAAGACTLGGPRRLDSELAPALRFAPSFSWTALGDELGRLRALPGPDAVLDALLRHEADFSGKDWAALVWSPRFARGPDVGPAAAANGLIGLARALLVPPRD